MKRQVTYLMSGQAHLPYLVVSLDTLRRYWKEDIVVYAWPESFDIVEEIARDKNLNIKCYKREPSYRGKNAQFLDKIELTQSLDCGISMYLDADTSVHGSIEVLFDRGLQFGFAATQFNEWLTGPKGVVAARVKRLKDHKKIEQVYVKEILKNRWPSVNGGVWTARPNSEVLPLWYEWTMIARKIFIADETVLHVLQPKYIPLHKMTVVCENGKYNSSPKHKSPNIPHEDVSIYHYHGDSNVRPQKTERGLELWWPMYMDCIRRNVGSISKWHTEVRNKWIDKLLKERNMYV